MEIVRRLFTSPHLKEGLHNAKERLQNGNFGIVIDMLEVDADPSKTLVVYFSGRYFLKQGQKELDFLGIIQPTEQIAQQGIQRHDLIRIDYFMHTVTRVCSLSDIQEWRGKHTSENE